MATSFNETHIQFNGHVFNESLLNKFNYTFWGNGTLSNSSSNCFLVFGMYTVDFFANGTAYNGTKCDSLIHNIALRGGLGLGFGVAFGIMIILGTSCLSKHGRGYLPVERHFRLVSRRWPWYWFLVAAACGCISGFVSVDVDRSYLQGSGLILQNAFYYVMLPAMLGSVWEMTRHWGSFCERRLLEEDAWQFPHNDMRVKLEFYVPLVFYLFGFLTFFLSVLRSWNPIAIGSWPAGRHSAIAAATDPRFKASSIMAVIAWLAILVSVSTSIKYYPSLARQIPLKIPLCLAFIFVRIVYNVAVAWKYDIGPMKAETNAAYIYVLGYGPIMFCMIVMVIWGKLESNEDLVIKRLRREREHRTDFELGITGNAPPKS